MSDNAKISLVIVDYGMGNVRSVQAAFSRLGCAATITSDPNSFVECDGLVLPGVGAFGKAMENLHSRGLVDPLNTAVMKSKKPILGICLGMQLFAESSTELGTYEGLGWLPGKVERIETASSKLSLPHVGWNNLSAQSDAQFYSRIDNAAHFYFDHSYHFQTEGAYVSSTTEYGNTLVAAVRKDSIWGMQFHPEKSQTSGLKILRNYLNYVQGVAKC